MAKFQPVTCSHASPYQQRIRLFGRALRVCVTAALMALFVAVGFAVGIGQPAQALASTITAASCSQAHVQAAIDTAGNGDTVRLPGGSCTWSSGVSIRSSKGITLDGNGARINGKLSVDMNSTTTTRVTGFTFAGARQTGYVAQYLDISGSNSDAPFRVDNNSFTGTDSPSILVDIWGLVKGLIDNNEFYAPGNSEMIHNLGSGAGSTAGWSVDVTPGSDDAVYVEDNTFVHTNLSGNPVYAYSNAAMQNYYGARVVFRYNTMTMTHFDVHGTPGNVGGRWWEIYENEFIIVNNGNQADLMALRGGSGVAFNNTATFLGSGTVNTGVYLREEDTGSYPLLYQIGRGKNQQLDPAYIWGNWNNNSIGVNGSTYIQRGRDYYTTSKPGYTPYTYPHPLRAGGAAPPAADSTAPSTPTNLAASAASTTRINLSWSASTDNVGVTGYRLERCTGASCSSFSQIATPSGTSYSNTGLAANTTYRYRVRAMDAAGNLSGYSSIATSATPPPASGGAVVNLPDCSQTTVQNAINSSSDGDILACPTGSWSWSNVNIVNHDITLQGAGIGLTNISITAAGGIEAPASNTRAFRVTGFTFASTGNFGQDDGYALMRIQGGHGWRVDNNRFEIYSNITSYNGGNGIYTVNDVSGVIDHNEFVKGGGSGCMHASIYPEGAGNTAWGWASQIGAFDHTVFIEDNYFYNPDACSSHNAHAVYGQKGAIYVARHNDIHGMNIDSHGFCATYGTREYEISNNTWSGVGSNNLFSVLHLRGGTGVVHGNSWSGNINSGYWFEDYRAQGNPGCGYSGTSYVPGYGNVSANQSCPEGYPCAQQVGRGRNNSADSLYIWNNTGTASINNGAPSYIQSGRDYMLNQGTKPGYAAYPYPHPLVSGTTPPPNDTTAPAVSLTAPVSGTTVSGNVTVSANASDNVGVVGVQFILDGANLGAEDTTNTYLVTWDSTTVADGTYTLTAVARDTAGNTNTSAPRTVTVSNAPPPDTTAPTAPAIVNAVAVSTSEIDLTWTASTDNVGVTGYRLERCTGASCSNFTQIASPSGTSYSDTGLAADTTYRYRVRAADAAGNLSSYSSVASATTETEPDTTAPSAPGNLQVSALSATEISVTWSASTDDVGVTGYLLERCTGASCSNFTQIAPPSGMSYSDTGLTAGTTYRYRVRAADAAGNLSSYSSVASATTETGPDTTAPSAPGNLQVSALSASEIRITWSASTDDVGVTGYLLERCTDASCSNFTQIASPSGTSYSDTGLAADTTYRYRVRAADAAGNLSSYSSVASATTQNEQTANEETIWGSRSTTSFDEDSKPYELGMVFIPTVDGQVTGVRVFGAPNEYGDHTVRLWRNSDGALVYGPHTITYSGTGWHEFGLSEPVSVDANQAYTVSVSTGEDAAGWYAVERGDPDLGTGGSNGLHLTYPASAGVFTRTIGERPWESWADSNYFRDIIFVAESATADTTAPTAPANVNAAAVSTSEIDLAWTASTDNVGVTAYSVERCEGANCTNFTQIASQAGTSYIDTGIAPTTTCRYRIRATDEAGNLSGYSDVASATTQAEPPGAISDENVYYPLEVAAGADGDWTFIDAPNGFTASVVIAGPPSFNDADPGVVRLSNVDDLGFDLRFQEWDYRQRLGDTTHALESIPYVVLEPGRHTMSDGSIWEVGTFSLSGTKSWQSVGFTEPFDSTPYLFLTVQTTNDPEAVSVRANSVSEAGFQAALFEEEALMNGHGAETIGYLAILSDSGGGLLDIDGKNVPYLLQSLSADERWIPVLSQRLKVEEEQSKGDEVGHVDETLHVLAFGQKLFAQQVSNKGGDTAALRRLPLTEDAPMEWGLVRGVDDSWKTLPLAKTYANPVVVAKPASSLGSDPGVIRLRGVGADRFELRYQEWGYLDGTHATEDIFYMVAEAGEHTLGGLKVEAALLESDKLALDGEWESVTFTNGFFDVPVVLAGVQTENDGQAVTTRIADPDADGFGLAMDEQESRNDGHASETLGWIAIEAGNGTTAEGGKVQTFFADVGDVLKRVNYPQATTHRYPAVVADIDSTFDPDPGFLRFGTPDRRRIDLKIAEEESADAETAHSPETVGIFVGE